MEIGIVGLPNVGKSSLFNALTSAGVAASNFPFTTIEPNVGVVPVQDERLDKLQEMPRAINALDCGAPISSSAKDPASTARSGVRDTRSHPSTPN